MKKLKLSVLTALSLSASSQVYNSGQIVVEGNLVTSGLYLDSNSVTRVESTGFVIVADSLVFYCDWW